MSKFHLLQNCTECTFQALRNLIRIESIEGDISMTGWTSADIPPQHGRIAVITGATGGLGYETALALAGAGATVVLTGRNEAQGRRAIEEIRSQFPTARISYEDLE